MAKRDPSIGIFLARPDRSYFMARGLRARGLRVVHYNVSGYADDAYVHVGPGRLSMLAHLLLRTHHDVYFTSLSFVPSISLYVNWCLRRRPYVFNYTGVKEQMFRERSADKPLSGTFERRLYPFLLDRVLAGASRIVCNSRYLERATAGRHPRYRARLSTIYNGIDFERYASGRPLTLPGVNPGDFLVVCVTSLDYGGKTLGVERVLDAFGRVRERTDAAKLVIAAKSLTGRYRTLAEEAVARRPFRDSVILLFNHGAIPDLLATGHAFVYATERESNDSLPRALLEAQAAGLPAVTTDTAGCSEIVLDGVTGFVVGASGEGMAERVLQLMDSPALRRSMGGAARQRMAEAFSWEQMAERYAEVFRAVAG